MKTWTVLGQLQLLQSHRERKSADVSTENASCNSRKRRVIAACEFIKATGLATVDQIASAVGVDRRTAHAYILELERNDLIRHGKKSGRQITYQWSGA